MLHVLRKVDYDSLSNKELASWMDDQFQTKIAIQSQEQEKDKIDWRAEINELSQMQNWGIKFSKNVPRSLGKSLFYICENSTTYFNQNFISRGKQGDGSLFDNPRLPLAK